MKTTQKLFVFGLACVLAIAEIGTVTIAYL